MTSNLDKLRPLLRERRMIRNPAAALKLVEWVKLHARPLSRKEHWAVAVTRMLLYGQALKDVIGNTDRQVEVGGALMDFLDGVMAREAMGMIGQTMSFRGPRDPLETGEFLDDGTLIVACPKCGLPSLTIAIPGETLYMHRVRVMPHGYDSLDHCTVPAVTREEL